MVTAVQENPGPDHFGFRKAADLVGNQKAPVWLLEGIYEFGMTYAVIGPPKHGKSVVTLDQAIRIALGSLWCERQTLQMPVFILAGEGHAGISRRLAAWEQFHDVSLSDALLYVSKRAASLIETRDAEAVAAEVAYMAAEHGKPGLVIVDTVARNFGPGNENTAEDMGKFILNCDRFIGEMGCARVLVHHTPLSNPERPRGSTALLGAVDGVFLVAKDDDKGNVTRFIAGDQKDAPGHDLEHAFELLGQTVGDLRDNFGNEVTAVVAQPSNARRVKRPTGKNQKLAMELLRNLPEPVTLDQWRDAFIEATSAKNPRDAWRAVISAAEAGEWCVIENGYAYPPEAIQ